MLNQLENLTKRLGGIDEAVDEWLYSRKQLLVSYYALVGIKPQKEKLTALNHKALENFLHNLIDYLSAGHFNLYDRITQQLDTLPSSKASLTQQVYPRLEDNTDSLMAFYDAYVDTHADDELFTHFARALSDVSELLENRFVLEDKLLFSVEKILRER